MSMYNLIENSYKDSSGKFWQYYRDEPNQRITIYEFFKFKAKITGS